MKRNKKNNKSFFNFLVKSYILFTIIIIISIIFIFKGIKQAVKSVVSEPKINELVDISSLINKNSKIDRVKIEKLTGRDTYIQILDENNKIIYDSNLKDTSKNFTDGELSCIQDYYDAPYAEVQEYTNDKGEKNISVSISYSDGEANSLNKIYVVDEKLNLIYTNTNDKRKYFTHQEFEYLKGVYPKGYDIRKYKFKDKNNNNKTLLIYMPSFDVNLMEKVYKTNLIGFGVFILFYILLIAVFIILLNRKVKRPLKILNEAIVEFKNGQRQNYVAYEGPMEFAEICDSFNEMSEKLYNSENKRKILEQEKQKMLADISHDLKTPITVIKGYSKAICDNLISEDDKLQYLMTIYKKADDLDELINTFHEYSKMDHPDYKFVFEEIDICEYVRAYLAQKYEELYISGVEIEADIPDIPIYCRIDQFHLKRVFENIISNSIKHNKGNLQILFMLEKINSKDNKIKITIADNGDGIPKVMYKSIFEPFVVGEKSRTKKGSGLGLAISKKIVEAHGGSIKLIEPRENYKTEFEILI